MESPTLTMVAVVVRNVRLKFDRERKELELVRAVMVRSMKYGVRVGVVKICCDLAG